MFEFFVDNFNLMYNGVLNNMNVLFSGIGVFVLSVIIKIIIHIYKKKRPSDVKNNIEKVKMNNGTFIQSVEGSVYISNNESNTLKPTKLTNKDISLRKINFFVHDADYHKYFKSEYINDSIKIDIDFEAREKFHSPAFAGAYIKFHKKMDICEYNKIIFIIYSPDNDFNLIYFECKSFDGAPQMQQFKIYFNENPKEIIIPISSIENDSLKKNLGEFTFAIYAEHFKDEENKKGTIVLSDFRLE